MSKDSDLKKKFIESWIPTIEKMLKREREFKQEMDEEVDKTKNILFYKMPKHDQSFKAMLQRHIIASQSTIKHLEIRLQEYKEYAAALPD